MNLFDKLDRIVESIQKEQDFFSKKELALNLIAEMKELYNIVEEYSSEEDLLRYEYDLNEKVDHLCNWIKISSIQTNSSYFSIKSKRYLRTLFEEGN